MTEKPYDQMNAAELKAALAEYGNFLKPARVAPDAPGVGANISAQARDVAATLYGAHLLKKPAGQFTKEEANFMWDSIRHYEESQR